MFESLHRLNVRKDKGRVISLRIAELGRSGLVIRGGLHVLLYLILRVSRENVQFRKVESSRSNEPKYHRFNCNKPRLLYIFPILTYSMQGTSVRSIPQCARQARVIASINVEQ